VSRRKAVRYLVSGKVQGVFFRASTAQQARRLGLSGWARNLPSGEVEVVAAGGETQLAELAVWLWQGPPAAAVVGVVTEEWAAPVEAAGFDVR
jgi:acylphosphatase